MFQLLKGKYVSSPADLRGAYGTYTDVLYKYDFKAWRCPSIPLNTEKAKWAYVQVYPSFYTVLANDHTLPGVYLNQKFIVTNKERSVDPSTPMSNRILLCDGYMPSAGARAMSRNFLNSTATVERELSYLSDLHSGRANICTWDGSVKAITPEGEIADYAVPMWNGSDHWYLWRISSWVPNGETTIIPFTY